MQNGLVNTTKFPEEKWAPLSVPHSHWDHQFLNVISGLILDFSGFSTAYNMLYIKRVLSNGCVLYLVSAFTECQMVNLGGGGDLDGLVLWDLVCIHLSNVAAYSVIPLLCVFT